MTNPTLPLRAGNAELYLGDCRDILRTLPERSVHCCVTSPPYFGLRDYGVTGQIGLEPSPEDFIHAMVEVFREVRRVLRDDATLWLNLGDSYAREPAKGGSGPGGKNIAHSDSYSIAQASKQGSSDGKVGPADRPGTRNGGGLPPKNLLMIPARVALALQAPDYLGNIRREADRAWLAALVDGEGCITIFETASSHGSGPSLPPILQLRMCDPECIEHAAAITGLGNVSPEQTPASLSGQRSVYHWRLNGKRAADTIAEIFPFLRIKRKQAIVAWNHQAIRDSYETKRGVKMPADALEKQRLCRDIIQRLNKREAVDLPSWMIEPPQPVGPGWYLRSDVIWAKPNPMPESVTDRPTSAHEHIFLLTKSPTYFYDAEAIREPDTNRPSGNTTRLTGESRGRPGSHLGASIPYQPDGSGRNARNVWNIPTHPFPEAHFATFPQALVIPCIKAGTSEKGCCPECGAPWIRKTGRERQPEAYAPSKYDPTDPRFQTKRNLGAKYQAELNANPVRTLGWTQSCTCHADQGGLFPLTPATVLDPFGGAGTTSLVANQLQRKSIYIELNPEYRTIAHTRLTQEAPLFA